VFFGNDGLELNMFRYDLDTADFIAVVVEGRGLGKTPDDTDAPTLSKVLETCLSEVPASDDGEVADFLLDAFIGMVETGGRNDEANDVFIVAGWSGEQITFQEDRIQTVHVDAP
jgi:hypothetical protein